MTRLLARVSCRWDYIIVKRGAYADCKVQIDGTTLVMRLDLHCMALTLRFTARTGAPVAGDDTAWDWQKYSASDRADGVKRELLTVWDVSDADEHVLKTKARGRMPSTVCAACAAHLHIHCHPPHCPEPPQHATACCSRRCWLINTRCNSCVLTWWTGASRGHLFLC